MEIILNSRDQKIFFYRILGSTIKSLSHEFGLSKVRIQQICKRAKHLQWCGPNGYRALHETPFGDYDPYLEDNWRLKKLANDRRNEFRMAASALLEGPRFEDLHP